MSHAPRRAVLVAAFGSPCPYCGEPMVGPDRWPTRDHIKPRRFGCTLDDASNRAVVCEPCNNDKGSLTLRRFRNRLRRVGDARANRVHAFREWHKQRLVSPMS
ncbi:MAG: hypothetical protein GEV13_18920 [Rhodospirillales bacterium]|nr:hypothetical protein [Rhodospirillales bacterium]